MTLTVILPTRRRPLLLRRAIESVLAQTHADLIVRVLDNASGDETPDVVAELQRRDARVQYQCHSENIGLERNFDSGLRGIDTPFFAFLSDDDLVFPGCYETLLKGFAAHPDAMASVGETLHVVAPRQIYNLFLRDWAAGAYDPPDGAYEVLRHGLPFWSAMVFRREVLERIGRLDVGAGALIDFDFVLRVTARCKLVVDKTPCALFFSHPEAVSRVKHLDFVWPGWLRMTSNLLEDPALDHRTRELLASLLRKRLAAELLFASLGCIRKRRYREGFAGGQIMRRHVGRPVLGFGVQALALAGFGVPLVSPLLTAFNRVRRWRSSRRVDRRELGAYLGYLDGEGQAAPP